MLLEFQEADGRDWSSDNNGKEEKDVGFEWSPESQDTFHNLQAHERHPYDCCRG